VLVRLSVCFLKQSIVTRDVVNSREIAFPGRESQFLGLNLIETRFRRSTYLRRNGSWVVGGGASGVGDARTPLPPVDDRDDRAVGGGMPETSQN